MRALREAPSRARRARPPVRTVYLGTSDFAAAVLERLARQRRTARRWS